MRKILFCAIIAAISTQITAMDDFDRSLGPLDEWDLALLETLFSDSESDSEEATSTTQAPFEAPASDLKRLRAPAPQIEETHSRGTSKRIKCAEDMETTATIPSRFPISLLGEFLPDDELLNFSLTSKFHSKELQSEIKKRKEKSIENICAYSAHLKKDLLALKPGHIFGIEQAFERLVENIDASDKWLLIDTLMKMAPQKLSVFAEKVGPLTDHIEDYKESVLLALSFLPQNLLTQVSTQKIEELISNIDDENQIYSMIESLGKVPKKYMNSFLNQALKLTKDMADNCKRSVVEILASLHPTHWESFINHMLVLTEDMDDDDKWFLAQGLSRVPQKKLDGFVEIFKKATSGMTSRDHPFLIYTLSRFSVPPIPLLRLLQDVMSRFDEDEDERRDVSEAFDNVPKEELEGLVTSALDAVGDTDDDDEADEGVDDLYGILQGLADEYR